MKVVITLSTQFGNQTKLYKSSLNGETVWRISDDNTSFHYHVNEVVAMAEEQQRKDVLEII